MGNYPLTLNMKKIITIACAITLLGGCNTATKPNMNDREKERSQAGVELDPLNTSGASGTVFFIEEDGAVKVQGQISGLEPNSNHAFHVHDVGDCGNNGENAGEHFNPLNTPHGKYGDLPHHAGDFPQLESDENGLATVDFTAETISLSEPTTNVLGRALIVHANEDKYTQPSGDAGARIACGVIQKKR